MFRVAVFDGEAEIGLERDDLFDVEPDIGADPRQGLGRRRVGAVLGGTDEFFLAPQVVDDLRDAWGKGDNPGRVGGHLHRSAHLVSDPSSTRDTR